MGAMIVLKRNAILRFVLCVLLIADLGVINAISAPILVKDTNGESRAFFSEAQGRVQALVFIFVLTDCPVSNSYAPELKRLRHAFSQIEFYLVYADPDVTAAEAKQHSKEYDFGFPGLLDPMQQLIQKSGVTRTPEAAVFSPEGKLLYRGRIDDRYVDFGKKLDVPLQRDLQDALDSILKHQAVRWPNKAPIGCFIPMKQSKS
jgi:hypothetical protein